jgi:hypothetical protein
MLSSWLPGTDVAAAWDGFSWCRHLALLHLAAKHFRVGCDADGLACHLH